MEGCVAHRACLDAVAKRESSYLYREMNSNSSVVYINLAVMPVPAFRYSFLHIDKCSPLSRNVSNKYCIRFVVLAAVLCSGI
jgi:hypothetical protein